MYLQILRWKCYQLSPFIFLQFAWTSRGGWLLPTYIWLDCLIGLQAGTSFSKVSVNISMGIKLDPTGWHRSHLKLSISEILFLSHLFQKMRKGQLECVSALTLSLTLFIPSVQIHTATRQIFTGALTAPFHLTPPNEGVESTSWNSVCLSVCTSSLQHF